MAADPNEVTFNAFADRLQKKLPAINIGTITGIISALLNLFGMCGTAAPTGAALKAMGANPTIADRVRLNMAMRQEGLRPLTPQGQAIAEAVFSTAAESSEADLHALVSYAQANAST